MRALHDKCEDKLGWSFSSSRKTLERMLDKGLVKTSSSKPPAKIIANISKTTCIVSLTRKFYREVLELNEQLPIQPLESSPLFNDEELEEAAGLLQV